MKRNVRVCGTVIRALLIVMAMWCGAAPAAAAEPADAQIKAAADDIAKYEQQFAGTAPVNAVTVNRTLRLLALTRQRLDSSPNRSHVSWIETDARLAALIGRLQGATSSTPPPTPGGPAASPAPSTGPGSPRASAPPQMISQHRVRIQKLIRDIASAADTLDRGGVKPFQSADYVAEQLRIAASFKESLAVYAEFPADADVVAAGAALTRFENMIAFGRQQAAGSASSLGDVQARLRALNENMGRVQAAPQSPYDPDVVRAWLAGLPVLRQAATDALQQLTVIREQAHLPIQPGTVEQGSPYDMQDVDRIERGYRDNLAGIDQVLAQFAANLDLQVTHAANTLGFVNGLDPANASVQTNSFLGAGAAARVRAQLEAEQQLVTVAVDFDRQLQRNELAAHREMLARVEKARVDYEAKLLRARELVRVPRAASTDRTLLSTARDTLKHPDYAVGPIRRIVINADKVHREKKTSETQFDKIDVSAGGNITLSGTETTYTYAWDQFQVATVEAEGGTFFIYYNTLKNFTSGGPTTPLNRWIVAERFQGSEIPEANIDRD